MDLSDSSLSGEHQDVISDIPKRYKVRYKVLVSSALPGILDSSAAEGGEKVSESAVV
jgi:hypothetical protein